MTAPPPPTVARAPTPYWLFICHDGPEAPALRTRDLDGHLAHVEAHWTRYLVAGPLREPGADALNGSMFIVSAETVEDAWALMRADPYITNGQYARIDVRHVTASIGVAVGGKIWADAQSIRHRAAGGDPSGRDA